ncbi:MAG: helix-turn-helix domain-containing protein [Bacteroidota bacterium]|nr:helix-turn-helix domain-containing protein [Bacteroidota bacterium]
MKKVITIEVPETRFKALENNISNVLELLEKKEVNHEKQNYTPKEFCEVLRISLPTFNRLKRDGKIEFIKLGKRTFINSSVVEKYKQNGFNA